MKQRTKPQLKWKPKLFASVLMSLLVLLMHTHYPPRIITLPMMSTIQRPKIAFLFIARNRLPLDMLWDVFFQSGESKFSIYVHSRPGFLLIKVTTRSVFFVNRHVNDSVQVDWGEVSMIEAERILLRYALEDPLNQRCIPLYGFKYIYDYHVDSFADKKMAATIQKWILLYPYRVGEKDLRYLISGILKRLPNEMWVVLTRKHAEVVVKDNTVFPMFQLYCKAGGGNLLLCATKPCLHRVAIFIGFHLSLSSVYRFLRKSLPEFWRDHPVPADNSKEHNCIPDEHYVQTLLAQEGLEGEITRRSLTHSSWDLTSTRVREHRGWHPMTYKYSDATPMLIKSIKDVDNINYETEYRREWCSSKGKPSPCFLFARRFTRPAALRLLNTDHLSITVET